MSDRLQKVLSEIDAANALDPNPEPVDGSEQPACLLYGQRMSAELEHLFPDAGEHLRIAARGQHIERWKSKRTEYPEGRAGYLKWRRDQAAFHAERVSSIMEDAGYPQEDRDRVASLLRKEGIKRNPEMQRLEDIICFTFLRWYLAGFAEKHDRDGLIGIVAKTSRKMSDASRAKALAEFEMPEDLGRAFAG